MAETKAASGGIGCGEALALLFIGLKLGGVITWSWWWVLAPIWIPLSIVALFLVAILVLLGIAHWR